MSTKELGIITLRGFLKDMTEDEKRAECLEGDVKELWFLCPNTDHDHSMRIFVSLQKGPIDKVWKYSYTDITKIKVEPSILVKEDFHCGIPTNFSLVTSMDEIDSDFNFNNRLL